MNVETVREIFNINNLNTFNVALNAVFQFQLANNSTYKEWCNLLKPNYIEAQETTQIPFLPISFLKHMQYKLENFHPLIVLKVVAQPQVLIVSI